MLVLLFVCAGVTQGEETDGYKAVTGPCQFSFPENHGAHPGYQTEWWYYTGNLTATTGERFGFQLTFFRHQLRPSDARRDWPEPASAWRTNQIYLAHAALTDLSARRHLMAEKVSREGLGMAGADRDAKGVRIYLHDWQTVITLAGHTLRMTDEAFDLALTLAPTKGPVAHGEDGYSRKGSLPDQASCYYSFPRLAAKGRVRIGENHFSVTGQGWMDHEFSTAPLAKGLTGWDWFSLQLDNQHELMIYRLRQETGGVHPASSGTLIGPEGEVVHLALSDFQTRVIRRWTSPATGGIYPLDWAIRLPAHGIQLTLTAALDAQEMITTGSTGVTYWEGSVSISGEAGGKPVSGKGYMELTGYADPEAPPL
ncbi:MAG: lipocalin-like domain-containing protein [Desulfobacterales bacterium]